MKRTLALAALALDCSTQPLTREQDSDQRTKIRATLFVPDRLPLVAATVGGFN